MVDEQDTGGWVETDGDVEWDVDGVVERDSEAAASGLDYQNVGQATMAIAGALASVYTAPQAVGGYPLTMAGSLVKKTSKTMGGYAMTMAGTLVKKGFVTAGAYAIAIAGGVVGALTKIQVVGGYAMTIAGTIVRKTSKNVGGYAIAITGVLTRIASLFARVGGYTMAIAGAVARRFIAAGAGGEGRTQGLQFFLRILRGKEE